MLAPLLTRLKPLCRCLRLLAGQLPLQLGLLAFQRHQPLLGTLQLGAGQLQLVLPVGG
jgi:hypothetical protein